MLCLSVCEVFESLALFDGHCATAQGSLDWFEVQPIADRVAKKSQDYL